MKLWLVSIFACALAWAQPVTTQVQDTIYTQFGVPYTGSVRITLSTKGITSGSSPVESIVTTLQITNGVLNTALVPNDTATPARSSYNFAFGNGDIRNCVIPTSATPISLTSNICTSAAPANPTPLIPLAWISTAGTTLGAYYCLQSTVNGWVAVLVSSGNCGSGGGSGALSWSALTSTQWSNITSSSFATLVN